VPATDTTPQAAAVQLELYRAAGSAGRVRIAVELSEAVRQTALAGIRRRHPEFSEDEVADAFLMLLYGFGRKR
jgi:hypothetical protein